MLARAIIDAFEEVKAVAKRKVDAAGRGRETRKPSVPAAGGPTVRYTFGATFTAIRTIPLQVHRGRITVTDVLAAPSGRFWVADARARMLLLYSQEGQLLRVLDRSATGLRRPVSLTTFHGRWVAALDGGRPAIVILDDRGRTLRRFPLPELDRPLQVCNVADRLLAVVGAGWGRGSGRLIHLYSTAGEHAESLYGEPRSGAGRAYAAVAGQAVYLGHTATDSFAIYDLQASAVSSFPCCAASVVREEGRAAKLPRPLRGLFATACGPLIAAFTGGRNGGYHYDLYDLNGSPIALGLESPERIIGVEGPIFYSVRTAANGAATLRVWKLGYSEGGSISPAR